MEVLRHLYLGSVLHKCRQTGAQSVLKTIDMEKFEGEALPQLSPYTLNLVVPINVQSLHKVDLPCHILLAAPAFVRKRVEVRTRGSRALDARTKDVSQ